MRIDHLRCTRCGACVEACIFSVITLGERGPEVGDGCTRCGACAEACPEGAISFPTVKGEVKGVGTMVVGECDGDGFKEVTFELITKARELSGRVDVLVAAPEGTCLDELFAHGADRVLHLVIGSRAVDVLVPELRKVIEGEAPSVLLIGASPWGRELAPGLASSLGVGLTADCTALEMEGRRLLQTRPAFGGDVMATIVSVREPQMATVRPHVFAAERTGGRGEVIRMTPEGELRSAIEVISETVAERGRGIEDADILVSVGMGVGREALSLAGELASLLGGELACSRAVVEAGRLPHSRQVGQSGRTVAPKLYIAVGISGAVQHLVGMRSSRRILAVNTDPGAPIHRVADLGVIGDAEKVLGELISRLRSQ